MLRTYINISSFSDISSQLPFLKTLRTMAHRLIFKILYRKSDINTYYARTIFDLPEKLEGTTIKCY